MVKLTLQEREIVNAQEKWTRDYVNKSAYLDREIKKIENKKEEILKEGEKKGKVEGLKEGEKKLKEGKLAIAKSLKEKGLSILEIAQITGLAIEEVNEI